MNQSEHVQVENLHPRSESERQKKARRGHGWPGGLEVEARGVELPQETTGETTISNRGGAESGALEADPLLASVVARWATLSPEQRQMVASAIQYHPAATEPTDTPR